MTETWKDVPWEYDGAGWIVAHGSGEAICYVPNGRCRDEIGRAIAHAWNVDLAAARSWRELYGIDDSVKTRED